MDNRHLKSWELPKSPEEEIAENMIAKKCDCNKSVIYCFIDVYCSNCGKYLGLSDDDYSDMTVEYCTIGSLCPVTHSWED